jgi:anti-sigma regulatory factor (Ser/Thr protein kinase)
VVRAVIGSDSAWELPAVPTSVGSMRRRAVAFAAAAGASGVTLHALELAVSETVTNAVVHAYVGREPGLVRVRCWADGGHMTVEVTDEGIGIGVEARRDSPGVGHGLALVGAVVRTLEVGRRTDGPGTIVTMTFGGAAEQPEVRGLEPLCTLGIETLADASVVDVVSGGVLRRGSGEVAGDAELTAWLRSSLPPTKPGTATWAALREGGVHLVVHDPSVARSPGGTGEMLDLAWWVAVPLAGPDGAPAAMWGLGGRRDGRPVPSEGQLRALADAGRTDLTQEVNRAALRARLVRRAPGP